MRSAAQFCAGLVAIAAAAVLAELASARDVVTVVLIALLWYPIGCFFEFLLGWNPRPPANQDRT
ncbi:MAG TPA: hypothetical protein VN329_09250 [Roseomonas sp.]|nr:hypothetical protein [Roseomonas sp.]